MPLNLIDVQDQITRIASFEVERQSKVPDALNAAREALRQLSHCPEAARSCVRSAASKNPTLRAAMPREDEKIDSSYQVTQIGYPIEVYAVDGSQIAPDPHATMRYGVVNIAAFCYPYETTVNPFSECQTFLLYNRFEPGTITMESVNQERDFWERERLAEVCSRSSLATVGLIDGGLEVWAGGTGEMEAYRYWMEKHIAGLERLRDSGTALGGYIDQPTASPVMRLFDEAASNRLISGELRSRWERGWIDDRQLFASILSGGERSSVFQLFSPSMEQYTCSLKLNFFYFNAGSAQEPVISRVEVPEWVTWNKKLINRLHWVLLDQCRVVKGYAYPYALARAHEVAHLSETDRHIVQTLFHSHILQEGGTIEGTTPKQAYKDIL